MYYRISQEHVFFFLSIIMLKAEISQQLLFFSYFSLDLRIDILIPFICK